MLDFANKGGGGAVGRGPRHGMICAPAWRAASHTSPAHYTTLVHIISHLYTLYCTLHIIPSLRAPCLIYFVHIMHCTCAHHSNELQISSVLEQATLGKCNHAFLFPFLFVVDIQLILNSSSKFVVAKFSRQCTG